MKRLTAAVVTILAGLAFVPLGAGAALACRPPHCWGAIAWNPFNEAWRVVLNVYTPDGARDRAMSLCPRCRQVQAFRNSCFAVAIAPRTRGGFGAAKAAYEETARRRARRTCRQYNPGYRCRILASACTLRSYVGYR
jgi:hypothetical protein